MLAPGDFSPNGYPGGESTAARHREVQTYNQFIGAEPGSSVATQAVIDEGLKP